MPPMSDAIAPNIALISIETEMTSSFMDYAMSVIVARALPDARDGLKPVHRRILFAQRGLNNTYIPPHNLGEVIDGVLAMIADPRLSDDELVKLIPGPDFPTGGVIQGRIGILSAYRTGRGAVVLRGVAHVEELRKDRSAIIVTELPFMVNKPRWIEPTADLVRDRKLAAITA